jgi:hypothetical protein
MEERRSLIEATRQTGSTDAEQGGAIERRNEQFDLIQGLVPPLAALMSPYMRF